MSDYRVAWMIELKANSPEDAAAKALEIQRNPESIATHFTIAERCECGEFHVEECVDVDLMRIDTKTH